MKPALFIVTALAVMALALWAYQENYKTQAVLDEIEDLSREVGDMREALATLRAEWAYLNRPERLRELALLNFDRLGLVELGPEHFARLDRDGVTTLIARMEGRP